MSPSFLQSYSDCVLSTNENSNPFAVNSRERDYEVMHVNDVALVRFKKLELWSSWPEQHGNDKGDFGLG